MIKVPQTCTCNFNKSQDLIIIEREKERERMSQSCNWKLLSKTYQLSLVAYTKAKMPPKACFECKPGETIATLMGLDVIVHVHMITKMLLGHEPSFTDATHKSRFIQVDFICVTFESLQSCKRSVAASTQQNLGLTNICVTRAVTGEKAPGLKSKSRPTTIPKY